MIILIFGFLFLLILGIPAGAAMLLPTMLTLFLEGQYAPFVTVQKMVFGINIFIFITVPLFLLVANIMNAYGSTNAIFKFANSLVGHIRGGLALVNIVASLIFAGMSGAAISDIVGLGKIELEAMERNGYEKGFSAAVTASSSVVGPMVPPSVALVIYGVIAEKSITRLLIAGFLPGLFVGFILMGFTYFLATKRNYPISHNGFSIAMFFSSLKEAFFPLLTPIILVGGILWGVTTPTEASIIAVLYVFILSLVNRKVSWPMLRKILLDTVETTSMIVFLVSVAAVFGWVLSYMRIPHMMANMIISMTENKVIFLLLVNLVLLIAGSLQEASASIAIFVPILLPIAIQFGVDPIHLGVIIVFNLTIGCITPPYGSIFFTIPRLANISAEHFLHSMIPYFLILLSCLVIITFWPFLSLFLGSILI